MKKLRVKISKQTGYRYLEADVVKDHIDHLEKSIKTKALEDLNNRVFELERRLPDERNMTSTTLTFWQKIQLWFGYCPLHKNWLIQWDWNVWKCPKGKETYYT